MRPRAVASGLGLALLLAACAGSPDGGTTSATSSAASTTPSPAAATTRPSPSPSVFTSFVPGTEVPVVLDFTGPRAGGGGEVKGADYAGQDVAIWFFNPT
jgi:hypothetical protein